MLIRFTLIKKSVKRSETVINSTIQLFKHPTTSITSFLTDVLQNHVENSGLQKLFETANKTPYIKKYHHTKLKD